MTARFGTRMKRSRFPELVREVEEDDEVLDDA